MWHEDYVISTKEKNEIKHTLKRAHNVLFLDEKLEERKRATKEKKSYRFLVSSIHKLRRLTVIALCWLGFLCLLQFSLSSVDLIDNKRK